MVNTAGCYGFISLLVALSTSCLLVAGSEKLCDECGLSVQSKESGILLSKNYPETYPNNTCCEWKIQVPEGKNLILKFADLNIESDDCKFNYVKIFKGLDNFTSEQGIESFCGNLKPDTKEVILDTNQATIKFVSGHHISGRGFLLSYATTDHKDLLTCLDKASHFPDVPYSRKYCPSGCKDVIGDISGDAEEGYRHTSVLCKAAIHAGVILDELGGEISVVQLKGIGHYGGTRANGIQSKDGSLSDRRFIFSTNECNSALRLEKDAITATSSWQSTSENGQIMDWSADCARIDGHGIAWAADHNNMQQSLTVDLGGKKNITGIITTGSTLPDFNFYVKSYKIQYSNDGSVWKNYRNAFGIEDKVFEGNFDCKHQTRNNFLPSILARYIRIIPNTWNQRIALKVKVLGCEHLKKNRSVFQYLEPDNTTHTINDAKTEIVPSEDNLERLAKFVAPIVLSALFLLTAVCVYKTLQRKKMKDNAYGTTDIQKEGCWKQIKHPFARQQSTEFTIGYNAEKEILQTFDVVKSNMAEDYQQPLMLGTGTVTRKGSTFRPMDMDTKEELAHYDLETHYNSLKTANQYALPLTSQEPEYATPIIERHTFRKDTGYNVPKVSLTKKSSFNGNDCGSCSTSEMVTQAYQTPKLLSKNLQTEKTGYDTPNLNTIVISAVDGHDYQKPQVTTLVTEGYSAPRDCLKPTAFRVI
ncbi:discoidin, CUB and LCCL domain-containing protein 1 isoform X1 [Erpetoichthys calabaricus]|uniref:Discoidin, CUB and LCCL domain containing 1 n=1 Tax=Erpetoichthys calabaricus TaxID=27687 RepID=A0A8C4RRQ5_ERPCA|nr:discoidin, CUB and LCCL domain-containing protein 1 isoform X1 [Erpetoichthys calabaricus]